MNHGLTAKYTVLADYTPSHPLPTAYNYTTFPVYLQRAKHVTCEKDKDVVVHYQEDRNSLLGRIDVQEYRIDLTSSQSYPLVFVVP